MARSAFPSQNAQSTPCSDHCLKLRCRKSACHCGAKHVSKSKHSSFGPLFEVEMSKKCTPLWREARFQVKTHKIHQNTPCSDRFLKLRCRKSACHCDARHMSKSKHSSFGPLFEVEMSKKCTWLWREAHFEVNMLKAPHARSTFARSDVVSRGRRREFCTLPKVSKT